MSMTDDELRENVTIYWNKESLRMVKPPGWYILEMQQRYRDLYPNLSSLALSSNGIIRIFTYSWAMIRAWSDISSYTVEPSGPPIVDSPWPKRGELTTYALAIDDVDWATLDREHYFLMIDTSIHRLASLWVSYPAEFWSDHHLEVARNLFEICKQYLTIYGIAEPIVIDATI